MPALPLDDDVPSCSLWPFGRRRRGRENAGWARLADEGDEKAAPPSGAASVRSVRSARSVRSMRSAHSVFSGASEGSEGSEGALPPYSDSYADPYNPARLRPLPAPPHPTYTYTYGLHGGAHRPKPPTPPPRPDAYTLTPLQAGHTGRSHSSTISAGSGHSAQTSSTGEYMSLDADPLDDPESPARVAYLNARLSSLQSYSSPSPFAPFSPLSPLSAHPAHPSRPADPAGQPTSMLDIQDPKSRAPVRVAAALGGQKLREMPREERRLLRARAEADAWRHEANLVYHQLCAARILALERMYERNAWRERCEAVEEDVREQARREEWREEWRDERREEWRR